MRHLVIGDLLTLSLSLCSFLNQLKPLGRSALLPNLERIFFMYPSTGTELLYCALGPTVVHVEYGPSGWYLGPPSQLITSHFKATSHQCRSLRKLTINTGDVPLDALQDCVSQLQSLRAPNQSVSDEIFVTSKAFGYYA